MVTNTPSSRRNSVASFSDLSTSAAVNETGNVSGEYGTKQQTEKAQTRNKCIKLRAWKKKQQKTGPLVGSVGEIRATGEKV